LTKLLIVKLWHFQSTLCLNDIIIKNKSGTFDWRCNWSTEAGERLCSKRNHSWVS